MKRVVNILLITMTVFLLSLQYVYLECFIIQYSEGYKRLCIQVVNASRLAVSIRQNKNDNEKWLPFFTVFYFLFFRHWVFPFFSPCDASVSIYCKGGRERARLLDWKNVLDVSQEIWTSPLLYAIRKKIRVRTIEPQTLCVSKRKKGIYAYLQIFAWFIETG